MPKKKSERNILNEYMEATGNQILDEFVAVNEMRNKAHAEGKSFRGVDHPELFTKADEYILKYADDQVKEISIDRIKPLDFMWEIKDEDGNVLETRRVTNPFHIREDDDMRELRRSIEAQGQLEPVVLRQMDDETLMCLSGHRRLYVLKGLNREKIKARIIKCSDVDAVRMMIAYNTRRENPLPSEIAWNYRYQMEAARAQGKRNDISDSPEINTEKGKSASDKIGQNNNTSGRTVKNYIRLTYLIPDLLDLVDNKMLKIKQAVQLSFINPEMQKTVCECLKDNFVDSKSINGVESRISLGKAHRVRVLCEKCEGEGKELDPSDVFTILDDQIPSQERKTVLTEHEWRPLLSTHKNINDERTRKKYILNALELSNAIDQELVDVPKDMRQDLLAQALHQVVDEYKNNNPDKRMAPKVKRKTL